VPLREGGGEPVQISGALQSGRKPGPTILLMLLSFSVVSLFVDRTI